MMGPSAAALLGAAAGEVPPLRLQASGSGCVGPRLAAHRARAAEGGCGARSSRRRRAQRGRRAGRSCAPGVPLRATVGGIGAALRKFEKLTRGVGEVLALLTAYIEVEGVKVDGPPTLQGRWQPAEPAAVVDNSELYTYGSEAPVTDLCFLNAEKTFLPNEPISDGMKAPAKRDPITSQFEASDNVKVKIRDKEDALVQSIPRRADPFAALKKVTTGPFRFRPHSHAHHFEPEDL